MPPKSSRVAKQRTPRRKIALACDACREKKIRCDGGKTICGSCLRRSYGIAQCAYSMENPRTASQDEYIRVLRSRIDELEDICLQAGVSAPALRIDTARSKSQHEQSSPKAIDDDQVHQTSTTLPDVEPHVVVQEPVMSGTDPSHQQSSSRSLQGEPTPSRSTIRGTLDLNVPCGRRHMYISSEPSSVSPHFDSPGHVTAMGQISTPDNALTAPTPVREFYGSSSTASLMRFARVSIPWQSSTSANAGPDSGHYQFRESPNTQYRLNDFSLPPRSLADHLLECFWDHVGCIYPFFDRPSFEKAYDNLWKSKKEDINELPDMHIGLGGQFDSTPNSIVFHCALNVMFALGCHFSDIPLHEREATAHSFFLRSKRFVGLDLLEIHTIGVVQTLLMVALYLQSSPYPSRCWNAIGLACRLAQGLGLHEPNSPSSMMPLETEVRRRSWHGCVMLDVSVSMTHGRPSMTSHLTPFPLPFASGADIPITMRFYVATIELYRILDKVLSDVYNMWRGRPNEGVKNTFWSEGSFDPLLDLERQLQSFQGSLPSYLNWVSPEQLEHPVEESAILERQRNILRSRYYYIRLLLYRPIFTQVCSENISPGSPRSRQGKGPAWGDAESSLQSCIVNKCATTCVSTAIDLVQLTYETYLTPFTDAWWYNGFYASTCALVLIMASSVPSLSDSVNRTVIEESWKKSETVLAHMATFSQSARTAGAQEGIPDGPTSAPPQTSPLALDSSYWTDSDYGFGTLQDDLGLLSWIDVPDMRQWLRTESRPGM
ncbi:fungal-specific transcription factor, partial [Aspergillus sclerotiicarbonarius CBS 121057]